MSGGGSRGALQAGAIFALREAGIVPDFVVGSSVGALNALHLACHGFEEAGLTRLRKTWEKVHKRNIFPSNPWFSAFRFLQGKDSLHGGTALRKFVTKQIPSEMKTFGDLLMPCYLTATDLRTQRLYLFGESADSEFLEAALPAPPFRCCILRFRIRICSWWTAGCLTTCRRKLPWTRAPWKSGCLT